MSLSIAEGEGKREGRERGVRGRKKREIREKRERGEGKKEKRKKRERKEKEKRKKRERNLQKLLREVVLTTMGGMRGRGRRMVLWGGEKKKGGEGEGEKKPFSWTEKKSLRREGVLKRWEKGKERERKGKKRKERERKGKKGKRGRNLWKNHGLAHDFSPCETKEEKRKKEEKKRKEKKRKEKKRKEKKRKEKKRKEKKRKEKKRKINEYNTPKDHEDKKQTFFHLQILLLLTLTCFRVQQKNNEKNSKRKQK